MFIRADRQANRRKRQCKDEEKYYSGHTSDIQFNNTALQIATNHDLLASATDFSSGEKQGMVEGQQEAVKSHPRT